MNNIIKRIVILLGIFIVAVAGYFFWSQRSAGKSNTVYVSMEEPGLPVVYMNMFDRTMNCLHGYTMEMGNAEARTALTVLPADRSLQITAQEYKGEVIGVHYEIRTTDMSRLVERTDVSGYQENDGTLTAVLPIQNLLTKEKEYLLDLMLDTADYGTVHYYTRIIWTDNANIQAMIDLAANFSSKTYNYDLARELTTYLESSETADNSSLAHVSINNSFNQLTWAGLAIQQVGESRINLKELDGIMGEVEIAYEVSRENEKGYTEYYEVTDHFTMKWNAQRIYMMNYNREMNQIFEGWQELYTGKRIIAGIVGDDQISTKKSPDQNTIAFVSNRDLWTYDQHDGDAVRVFSFRSGTDDGIRSSFDRNNCKILSVEDDGSVDFLVYGYMNRGIHEGRSGVVLYHYNHGDNTLEERFFAPVSRSYEALKSDVNQLAYLGDADMFYMMLDHAVYGVDLNSREYVLIAKNLSEGSYAVGAEGQRLAWQDADDIYGASKIQIMNLDTGRKLEIQGEDGGLVRALGYVGNDFVYGLAREGDAWRSNSRIIELPMYAVQIVDDDLNVQKRYEKPGKYVSSVTVDYSRVHLNEAVQIGNQSYYVTGEDTIVCNEDTGTDPMKGIGWFASDIRERLSFIQLNQDVKANRTIKTTAPKKMTHDESGELTLTTEKAAQKMVFYAYGAGHLKGIYQNFAEAVQTAYADMGYVTGEDQTILWNRVNRTNQRNIREVQAAAYSLEQHLDDFDTSQLYDDGVLMLDARGCSLSQVLYFIDQGMPVLAYTDAGQHVVIYGFDAYNISVYDPAGGSYYKMGLNDAAAYFDQLKNDFLCGLKKN